MRCINLNMKNNLAFCTTASLVAFTLPALCKRASSLRSIALFPMLLGPSVSVFAQHSLEESSTQFEGESLPLVITPTRLKQSHHDAPASVTRISAETLHLLQIRTIAEALRYVSGMVVDYASGNQPRVNYHGTNGLVPRRMQVTVDGISVYRAGYAEISWPVLPVSVDDVLYIEVIRSPSSSAYGENSMMAAINIVTQSAETLTRPSATLRVSNSNERYVHTRFATPLTAHTNLSLSASAHHDDGYDENFRDEERHDSFTMGYLRGRLDYQFDDHTTLDVYAAYSQGLNELEYRDAEQQSFPDIQMKTQYYQADFRHGFSAQHEIKIKTYYSEVNQKIAWDTCRPAAFFLDSLYQLDQSNPDYVMGLFDGDASTPQGGSPQDDALAAQVLADVGALGMSPFTPVCGEVNEDGVETKLDIEVEDTYVFSDAIRLVYGAGYLRKGVQSDTFVNGYVEKEGVRGFANGEFKYERLTFNLGLMAEEAPQVARVEYSPRFGVNFRYLPNHSVRYSLSKAVRTPDILETERDWRYRMSGASPTVQGETELAFFKRTRSDTQLSSETIISNEVAAYGLYNAPQFTFEYDVKVFYDRLYDLISEKQQYFDYQPTNQGRTILKGAEFDLNWRWYFAHHINQLDLHLNYARVWAQTNNFYETSLHADHVGAAYLIARAQGGWYGTFAYYGNSPIQGEAYDGFELGGGKMIRLHKANADIAVKWIYQPDLHHSFTVSEQFAVENNHASPSTLMLRVKYEF